MKLFFKTLTIIPVALFIFACSGSEETTENTTTQDQEIYIFDDVNDADSTITTNTELLPIDTVESIISLPNKHIVQVGAYTTEERAQRFVMLNQPLIKWKMKISFSTKVELWVVQLPSFETRAKAEEVRNNLWKIKTFQDAFIVPVL